MTDMRTIELDDIGTFAASHAAALVDVYFFDRDLPLPCAAVLDAGERSRCERFATPQLRDRYRRCHHVKRAILAAYLRQDPADIAIELGEFDKPRLRDGSLQFNLSHSDGWAAVAIARDEIGIDCERVNEELDYRSLVPTVAHPREAIASRSAFFRAWTRKEAVLKQLGLGFQLAPERIRVPDAAEPLEHWERACIEGRDAPLVRDVPAPRGFAASVAAPAACAVRVFELRVESAVAEPSQSS